MNAAIADDPEHGGPQTEPSPGFTQREAGPPVQQPGAARPVAQRDVADGARQARLGIADERAADDHDIAADLCGRPELDVAADDEDAVADPSIDAQRPAEHRDAVGDLLVGRDAHVLRERDPRPGESVGRFPLHTAVAVRGWRLRAQDVRSDEEGQRQQEDVSHAIWTDVPIAVEVPCLLPGRPLTCAEGQKRPIGPFDVERGAGGGADGLFGGVRGDLAQHQPGGRDVDDRQLGDDLVDDPLPGQRQGAALQDLVAAVARGVLHRDDDAPGARHQIHGAAHALHHLAGDHPVGEVALLVHLERAQHGDVDVPAAHHREGVRAAEVGGAGQLGDGLLAGVDEVGVHLVLGWIRSDAQHPVLGVQRDLHARGHVVRHQRRHADAEVDVVAIPQRPRDSGDDALALIHGWWSVSRCAARRSGRAGCAARRCRACAPGRVRWHPGRPGARPRRW